MYVFASSYAAPVGTIFMIRFALSESSAVGKLFTTNILPCLILLLFEHYMLSVFYLI